GTDRPFLWFGAPWMKAEKIAKKLSKAGLKGVKFSAMKLTPSKDVYEGKACEGIKIEITEKSAVRALDIFVHAVHLLKKYNGADFTLKPVEIRKMTGSSDLYTMLEAGAKPAEIIAAFEKNNADFKAGAVKFLLYK
ncbi:MAG: DUF1343 domain-containing protein, partial [Elusimicrobiota bacterium]|nr:DUF1343 domain-containing protein [Elusimicrobiota bacterium]